jgi:hypothetical protein
VKARSPSQNPMTVRGNTQNLNRGYIHQRRREGHVQRAARRLLIAMNGGPVTTREVVEYAWPDGRLPLWRWGNAVEAVARYADRIEPRSRPLLWKAKSDLVT